MYLETTYQHLQGLDKDSRRKAKARTKDPRLKAKARTKDYKFVLKDNITGICSHLQDRFGPVQQKLFGLSALVPAHLGSYNDVVAGASLYESLISVHELPTEFELWTEQWTRAGEAEWKKLTLLCWRWNAVIKDL